MRRIRHILAAMVVLLALAAVNAEAVTVRDIIELSKAGLGDDVLLALIEVDRPVFSIDTTTLKSLKDAGVSQQVIIAMIRSGRLPAPEPPPPPVETMAPPPDAMPVEPGMEPAMGYPPPPQVVEVPVAVPVAVPVPVYVNAPRRRSQVHRVSDAPLNHAIQIPISPSTSPSPLGGNNLSPQHSDLSPRHSDLSPKPSQSGHCTQPVYWGFGGKLRPGSWQPPSSCQ